MFNLVENALFFFAFDSRQLSIPLTNIFLVNSTFLRKYQVLECFHFSGADSKSDFYSTFTSKVAFGVGSVAGIHLGGS